MATLSYIQMEFYASTAGFSRPGLMAAIGYAESGGRTDVVNSIGCVGVWQINQRVHSQWSVKWLKDPANNAYAAKKLWDADVKAGGDGTGPWTDSKAKGQGGGWGNTQAYKDFQSGYKGSSLPIGNSLNSAADSVGNAVGSVTDAITAPLDGLATIAAGEVAAAKWLSNPSNWLRIGYVAVGLVIITVVSVNMAEKTSVGKAVTGAVAKGIV